MPIITCRIDCTCGRHSRHLREPHSLATKLKIGAANYGRTRTTEQRAEMSKLLLEAYQRGERKCSRRGNANYSGDEFANFLAELLCPLGYKREYQLIWGPDGRKDKYKLDFALLETKIDIEADGLYHDGSQDEARDTRLKSLGWKVIRVRYGD